MASGFEKFNDYGRDSVKFVCLYTLNRRYRESSVLKKYCYGEHTQPCWEVEAHWSVTDNRAEVERCNKKIRPLDSSKKLSLCRYYWKCERRDHCIYAHSIKELDNWSTSHQASHRNSEPNSLPLHQAIPERRSVSITKDRPHEHLSEDHSQHGVSRELTTESYKTKFKALLQMEREAHKEKIKSICDGVYFLHIVDGKNVPYFKSSCRYTFFGYVSGMKGDAINYGSRSSNGKVEIIVNSTLIRGDILSCNSNNVDDKLYLGFSKSYQIKDDQEVSLTFMLNSVYFERLINAVSSLKESMVNRILPSYSDFLHCTRNPSSSFSSNLSPQQIIAFETIVSMRKGVPPVLITGSFGCGKTHILAKSVIYFLKEDKDYGGVVRILVGTQQNVSADNFLKLCLQFLIKKDSEMFVVRLNPAKYSSNKLTSDRKYYWTINEIDHKDFSTRKKVLVITTCSTSHTAFNESVFPRRYFTHVLLDECAQMREPEAIAPLCLAHPDAKLVMAGDQQQVGPSSLVIGEKPRNYGLSISILERLYKYYKGNENSSQSYLCELTENYRCHKEIVKFCNEHFYDGARLTSNIEEKQFPMQFVCSSIELKMDLTDHCRVYREEAAIIVEELCKVYECWPKSHWGQEKDCSQIVIAASTRAQLSEVEGILQQYSSYLQLTKKVPTYDIQGKEFRAVIISTSEPTQANGLPLSMTDSICIPQVFNTVVSRARSLVIVVGNPLTLLVKEKCILGNSGGFWKSYLKLCLQNGTLRTDSVSKKSPQVHSVFMDALKGLLQDNNMVSSLVKDDKRQF